MPSDACWSPMAVTFIRNAEVLFFADVFSLFLLFFIILTCFITADAWRNVFEGSRLDPALRAYIVARLRLAAVVGAVIPFFQEDGGF
jgi:hypothetical protein